MSIEIVIVGAGAIGTYLAVALSSFANVRVVVRDEESARELRARGFELSGAVTKKIELNVASIANANLTHESVVIVTTKATDLEDFLRVIEPRLAEQTSIVLAQNGIGILNDALEVLPGRAFIRAACWMGVRSVARGSAIVAGVHSLALAASDERSNAIVNELAQVSNAAGIRTHIESDVRALEWKKALWNIAVNSVCTLADKENGAILDDPKLRACADAVLDEAFAVAKAVGVSLEESDRERVFQSLEVTRSNINATLQDVRAKRPTETRWLVGKVSELGNEHSVLTPACDVFASVLQSIEMKGSRLPQP